MEKRSTIFFLLLFEAVEMNFHERNSNVTEEISDSLELPPEIIVDEDGNFLKLWIDCAKLHNNYKCYYFPVRIKKYGIQQI